MKRYKIIDGGEVGGNSAEEILAALNNALGIPSKDLNMYVKDLARALKAHNGSIIRIDSYENVIEDLVLMKFLEEIK